MNARCCCVALPATRHGMTHQARMQGTPSQRAAYSNQSEKVSAAPSVQPARPLQGRPSRTLSSPALSLFDTCTSRSVTRGRPKKGSCFASETLRSRRKNGRPGRPRARQLRPHGDHVVRRFVSGHELRQLECRPGRAGMESRASHRASRPQTATIEWLVPRPGAQPTRDVPKATVNGRFGGPDTHSRRCIPGHALDPMGPRVSLGPWTRPPCVRLCLYLGLGWGCRAAGRSGSFTTLHGWPGNCGGLRRPSPL